MSTVPWIRFYTSFPRHRKTVVLKRELGTYEPIVNLWCWAADNAQDGDLAGFTNDELEDFAGWKGRKGVAINALLTAGFLDEINGKFRLHDWMDGTGAGIESLMKTRNRQRGIMKQKRGVSDGVSANKSDNIDANASTNPLTLTLSISDQSNTDRVSDDIKAVFAHYRKHHPRACKAPNSSMPEWRKIKARIGEGSTVEDLCKAIDGYHMDKWHTENNVLGLEYIMRNASQISKGLGFKSTSHSQKFDHSMDVVVR